MKEQGTLRVILERLDSKFPEKNVLTAEDIAEYCGRTPQTMRKKFPGLTDKVVFAKWLASNNVKGEAR